MLTTADIAAMRAEQDAWMTGTAVVQTNVPVSDGAGGFADGWSASGTVACRVSYRQGGGAPGGEVELGAAIRDVAPWIVTLPASTTIRTRDRLLVDARVLEVVAVASAHTLQTAIRAACVEVR